MNDVFEFIKMGFLVGILISTVFAVVLICCAIVMVLTEKIFGVEWK